MRKLLNLLKLVPLWFVGLYSKIAYKIKAIKYKIFVRTPQKQYEHWQKHPHYPGSKTPQEIISELTYEGKWEDKPSPRLGVIPPGWEMPKDFLKDSGNIEVLRYSQGSGKQGYVENKPRGLVSLKHPQAKTPYSKVVFINNNLLNKEETNKEETNKEETDKKE